MVLVLAGLVAPFILECRYLGGDRRTKGLWIACCLLLGGVAPENLRGRGLPLSTFLRVPELAMRMAFAATGEAEGVRAAKKSECDQRQRDLPSETRKDRLMTKSARKSQARRAEWEAAPGPWSDSEAEMLTATSYVPKKSSRNGALVFSVAVLWPRLPLCSHATFVEGRISLVGILAALVAALAASSSLHISLWGGKRWSCCGLAS